jgi:hypothetical protein
MTTVVLAIKMKSAVAFALFVGRSDSPASIARKAQVEIVRKLGASKK